jgi:cytochrome c biogenesis protein CcmG, thiol:disulfide interchange protein DsbE|tara:strand:- start:1235 stop:1756 length:522 start_codon:yes stop_codon:yes gene_type:complete
MKNKLKLFIIITFLSFCFIIFYKGLNNSNTYSPKISDKKNIPTFEAKDFNSNIYLNSEKIFEEDTYYIINIWASWCIPCRKEHSLLMELSKIQSIKLIGLNYRDNLSNAKNFINELGNPYKQILIDNDGTLAVEFGAYGVPETFIISKNKKIIKKFIGPINKEMVEEIKSIIK